MERTVTSNCTTIKDVSKLTPIQEFYTGTNVLITGSTGFVGIILLEKLLRSCPTISTIYVLIRSKKGKNIDARLNQLLSSIVFEKLRNECPKFRHKVIGIEGDCSLPGLGLSLQDKKLLTDEVDIIFHVAATVRFDESLTVATAINVRASLDLLRLAKNMPGLKSLVHVSTAYSNCIYDIVEEKIYPSSIDYEKLILLTEHLPENILNGLTSMLIGKYPNTYVYTKQMAESVIREEGRGLPVGIFRPGIVASTYKKPVEGWTNNINGPSGVATAISLGVLRATCINPKYYANIVPVDMCSNFLIAAAWEVGTTFEEARKQSISYKVPIYNYVATSDKPINWKDFINLAVQHGYTYPPSKAIWHYSIFFCSSHLMYSIIEFFVHTIPAAIVDGAMICTGKKPRLLKIYSRVNKISKVTSYFAINQWTFKTDNVRKLINKMSKEDKDIFFCDGRCLAWSTFCQTFFLGLRLYLLQDPLETVPAAQKRYRRFYWAHQAGKVILVLLLIWILWLLFYLLVFVLSQK